MCIFVYFLRSISTYSGDYFLCLSYRACSFTGIFLNKKLIRLCTTFWQSISAYTMLMSMKAYMFIGSMDTYEWAENNVNKSILFQLRVCKRIMQTNRHSWMKVITLFYPKPWPPSKQIRRRQWEQPSDVAVVRPWQGSSSPSAESQAGDRYPRCSLKTPRSLKPRDLAMAHRSRFSLCPVTYLSPNN